MRLWDTRTWVRQLAYHHLGDNVGIACLTFSPDGRWLACGPNSRECEILNLDFLLGYQSLWSPPRGQDNPHGTQRPYASPSVAVFDPASTRFAAASSGPHDGITVTDVETGEEMLCLECRGLESIHDISFSSDGKVVLGALKTVGMEIISTWDASTGVQLLTLKEHTDMVRQARFSPCGKYIVSASDDGTVRLWRTSNGLCMATFSEHEGRVEHIAFSPDGKMFSSGSSDGMVVIRHMHEITPTDIRLPSQDRTSVAELSNLSHSSSPPYPSSSRPLPRSSSPLNLLPRLPWEVIESITDYSASADHPDTLCNLSLTCRQIRLRCRYAIFYRVRLKRSDSVSAFISFLQTNPDLRPLVHSIVVSPNSFRTSLLYVLPNLSSLEWIPLDRSHPAPGPLTQRRRRHRPQQGGLWRGQGYSPILEILDLHHFSLACFRRLGTHIQSLHLCHISFLTPTALARVLLAFTNLRQLVCDSVKIETDDRATEAPQVLNVLKQRLYKQMHLKTLSVRIPSPQYYYPVTVLNCGPFNCRLIPGLWLQANSVHVLESC